MELQALRRLEDVLQKVQHQHGRALERQEQLSDALGKSRQEMEKLRGEIERFKADRSETRKRVDALIKRFEKLELD